MRVHLVDAGHEELGCSPRAIRPDTYGPQLASRPCRNRARLRQPSPRRPGDVIGLSSHGVAQAVPS
jgi:hypothetical protein